MTFDQATGTEGKSYECQDGADYVRDDGGFAIACWGHYTVVELEFKLAQLKEANQYWKGAA
jgi:hypothetical protein